MQKVIEGFIIKRWTSPKEEEILPGGGLQFEL